MAFDFEHGEWRKLFVEGPGAWRMLPLVTRAIGYAILANVDRTGGLPLRGEDPADVLIRAMAAHRAETPVVKSAITALVADGYLVVSENWIRIARFAEAQGRKAAPASPTGRVLSTSTEAVKKRRQRSGGRPEGTMSLTGEGHQGDTSRDMSPNCPGTSDDNVPGHVPQATRDTSRDISGDMAGDIGRDNEGGGGESRPVPSRSESHTHSPAGVPAPAADLGEWQAMATVAGQALVGADLTDVVRRLEAAIAAAGSWYPKAATLPRAWVAQRVAGKVVSHAARFAGSTHEQRTAEAVRSIEFVVGDVRSGKVDPWAEGASKATGRAAKGSSRGRQPTFREVEDQQRQEREWRGLEALCVE